MNRCTAFRAILSFLVLTGCPIVSLPCALNGCRIGSWPASQCGTEECVEAHTRVDVTVDVEEVGVTW